MMIRKLLPIIVLVMVTSLSIAGCTSSTSSNQAAGSASQAASSTASASASATPTATPSPTASPSIVPTASPTPTPTPTPSPTPAPSYTVVITGPTDTNYGITWTATVYENGVPIPQNQLTGVTWYINGVLSRGDDTTGWGSGTSATMTHDANGLDGTPFQQNNVITAAYKGVTSAPAYFVDSELTPYSTPTATATATPTATPLVVTQTPTPTPTATPTPTVIR